MDYKPEPIDTSDVALAEDLLELTELLAQNTHDIWARQRQAEGWTWGLRRDDARKQHSCLKPYEELPESEKEYDRKTVMETLKTITALGYQIELQSQDLPTSPDVSDEEVLTILKRLRDSELDLAALLALWKARNLEHWSRTPKVYRLLGEQFLKLGEPLVAYDVIAEGLKQWQRDVRLRQLQGLALARSGATHHANGILLQLHREGHTDGETLGILARINKDFWASATDPAERQGHLQQAYEFYSKAYRLAVDKGNVDDGYYNGVNAASTSLLLGGKEVAHNLARQVRALCLREFERLIANGDDTYWIQATLGEVALVLGKYSEAVDWYAQAAEIGHRRLGDLHSTRRQARFLMEHLEVDKNIIECIEPYDKEQFKKDSVEAHEDADWGERYEEVLKRATKVLIASEQRSAAGTVTYDYANILLHGLASIRTRQLETNLVPLAVWDGKPGDGPGGTSKIVQRWQDLGCNIEEENVVNLSELLRTECPELLTTCSTSSISSSSPTVQPLLAFPRQIVAMLFADAKGFSKLTEEEIPRFVQHFLGSIAELLAKSSHAPVLENTWGDGLYFVFSNVRDAGRFALDLCDLVNNTNWSEKELPQELSLRIALHAGPAYECLNPITKQLDYMGIHVSRASRIEPITPQGQVYASQPFAALTETQGAAEFICEYVGQTLWAKEYGIFPTYHVRRHSK